VLSSGDLDLSGADPKWGAAMARARNFCALAAMLCLALMPVRAVAQESAWESLIAAGEAAYEQGDYAAAKRGYSAALTAAEQFGRQDIRFGRTLYFLARAERELGNYPAAEKLFKRSLLIGLKKLGQHHPQMARIYRGLGRLYHVQGKYGQAVSFHLRALKIREKSLGPDHPDVAQSLDHVAASYMAQGAYAKARPLLERAVVILEDGTDRPRLAKALHDLASVQAGLGDYGRARATFERSLAVWREAVGGEHTEVAKVLADLGDLYRVQGLYAEAEQTLKQAVAIYQTRAAPDDPAFSIATNNLALVYEGLTRYELAVSLLEGSAKSLQAKFGAAHPSVANVVNNIGMVRMRMGDFDEAERLLTRALEINLGVLDANHPRLAGNFNNIATLHARQGRYGEAGRLYQRALDIMEAAFHPLHPELIAVRGNVKHYRAIEEVQRRFRAGDAALATVAPKIRLMVVPSPAATVEGVDVLSADAATAKLKQALSLLRRRSARTARIVDTLAKDGEIILIYDPVYPISGATAIRGTPLAAFMPHLLDNGGEATEARRYPVVIGRFIVKWPENEIAGVLAHELAGHAWQHAQGRLLGMRVADAECEAGLHEEAAFQDLGLDKNARTLVAFRKQLEFRNCSGFKEFLTANRPQALKLWQARNPDVAGLLAAFRAYQGALARDAGP
jgi:tetratricopeptide (TPR) repeat protein